MPRKQHQKYRELYQMLTTTISDTRTPSVIWNQLNNFINQDRYLSSHRGEVADRNAAVLPYFKHLDLNITQDFYLKTGESKHT